MGMIDDGMFIGGLGAIGGSLLSAGAAAGHSFMNIGQIAPAGGLLVIGGAAVFASIGLKAASYI